MTVTIGIPTYNRPEWLREAMLSALSQSSTDFRLLISDNASDSRTHDVVRSFEDSRIDYVRSSTNVGMTGNINRIIELADSEFLVILPDDDVLYSTFLEATLPFFTRYPKIGAVHTAFDLIDDAGNALERRRRLIQSKAAFGVEKGHELIARGMRTSGLACWTACLFRTNAIAAAGGLRLEDEPFADGPLVMRIATDWDIAWVANAHVAVRLHENAISAASSGAFVEGRYETDDTLPATLFEQRMRFLGEAKLPSDRLRHYRRLAMRTYRRDTIGRLTAQVGVGRSRTETLKHLIELSRADVRVLFVPGILKLAAALAAGRPVDLPSSIRIAG
jgi:glycosyltransferase involved in cell wall biosynthesis